MYGIDDCFNLSVCVNFTLNFSVILDFILCVGLFNGNELSFFLHFEDISLLRWALVKI